MLELLETPATPLADALDRLEQAVSPLVGIVRTAPAIMVAADEARLHAFACHVASAERTTGAPWGHAWHGRPPRPAHRRRPRI